MKEHLVLLAFALIGCFTWGFSWGLRRANKDYKPAIEQSIADYRDAIRRHDRATRTIERLRNRLLATRIIEMKRLCPYPIGDKQTVADCRAAGQCGCGHTSNCQSEKT